MPGLVFGSRRFRVSSDDLFYPALGLAGGRACWTVTLCVYVGHVAVVLKRKNERCGATSAVAVNLFALAVLGVCSTVANGLVARESSRGVIFDAGARRRVPRLLALCCAFGTLELALTASTMWYAWAPRSMSLCSRELRGDVFERITLRVLATVQLVGLLSVVVAVYFLFDVWGSKQLRRGRLPTLKFGDRLELSMLATQETDWEAQCAGACSCARSATCGAFGGRDLRPSRALGDVAELVSAYFGSIDLVASDVLAGLALVRVAQRDAVRRAGNPLRLDAEATLVRDARLAADAAFFVDDALAIYGWKLMAYTKPLRALVACFEFALCAWGRCCASLDSVAVRREARAGRHALRSRPRDVVFEDFGAAPNKRVPVAVIVDDSQVVVACRGTLSLDDCVTDATARPAVVPRDFAPLAYRDSNDDRLAHAGILSVALELKRLVAEPLATHAVDKPVVVVGHSLGAGVAALLALGLKTDYPSTRCIAYAPPGALVDAQLADVMAPFCTSFVVGDDVVPRLGLASLVELRDSVIRALAHANVHKRKALATFLPAFPTMQGLFYAPDSPDEHDADTLVQACLASLNHDDAAALLDVKLAIPGEVYHVVAKPAPQQQRLWRCCARPRKTHLAYLTPRTAFQRIRISRRMFADHMPWNCAATMHRFAHDLDRRADDSAEMVRVPSRWWWRSFYSSSSMRAAMA